MQAKLPSIAQTVSNWWSRHTLAQRFATLTAVLITSSLAIFGVVLVSVSSHIVDRLERERVAQQLNAAAGLFTERVQQVRKIPLILSGTPPVERIVDLSTGGMPHEGESLEVWRNRAAKIFRALLEAAPSLRQVRLIGVANGGREVVRVDRVGGVVRVVDEADLQRKGDRSYFQEALKLRAGDVYLSPIDANVENGDVVRPFRPMIWAVTPIYTAQGLPFGVIAVNATPEAWLRDICAEIPGDFMVANQNGDYLFRSDGGPLVGSIDGTGAHVRHDRPQLEAIFNPNNPIAMSLTEGGQFISARRVAYKPDNPGEFAVLVMATPAAKLFRETSTLILLGVALVLILSGIGVIAAYFVSLPLKYLMGAAMRIAHGEFDDAALVQKGVEVGELGQALCVMRDAVERRDALLNKSDARMRAIVDNTIDGLITIDHQGVIVSYNRGCEHIFGYTIAEAFGKNICVLLSRSDAAVFDGFLDEYARSGQTPLLGVRHEFTGRRKSGDLIEIEVALTEINVDGEVLFSTIVRDITGRKLQEHNAQLATIVATSADAIISLSSEGTILSWNPGAELLFGYSADEVVGKSERILFAEDADEEFEEKYRHLPLCESELRDTVRRRRDGVLIDVAINAAPMRRPDGQILGFSASMRDTSGRRRVEKHMRVVMAELSHRTKNQLAVIMAMVRLTASSTTDAVVMQSELIQRLQSLSASHDLLVSDGWTGAPLEEIVHAVLQPFVGSSPESLECWGPSVTVNAVAVQNVGLALHELATNASKYGALSTLDGRVRLTWSFETDGKGQRRLILDWSERNGPPVQQPTIKGFGHVVIERVAPEALNADLVYEFSREGVHWAMAIPTDFVVSACSELPVLAQACA